MRGIGGLILAIGPDKHQQVVELIHDEGGRHDHVHNSGLHQAQVRDDLKQFWLIPLYRVVRHGDIPVITVGDYVGHAGDAHGQLTDRGDNRDWCARLRLVGMFINFSIIPVIEGYPVLFSAFQRNNFNITEMIRGFSRCFSFL